MQAIMNNRLEENERDLLLKIARQALEDAVCSRKLAVLDLEKMPESLSQPGASFVTLTSHGLLRGCIGALEARLPLAIDVQEHAMASALQDPRFPPVRPQELPDIAIEISRLTTPQPLPYDHPMDLPRRLRPGIDGVVIHLGYHRATFLPQVWEKIPQPEEFLDHLCLKLGTSPDFWRKNKLEVSVYQVEEFHEPG
jgi:uncharacterized protein